MAVLAQDRSELPFLVGTEEIGGGILGALWRCSEVDITDILVFAVVFRVEHFTLPPTLSDDSYRNVRDGLVQAHDVNPNRSGDSALAALPAEPVFDRLNSPDYFTVYPPVSRFKFASGVRFTGRPKLRLTSIFRNMEHAVERAQEFLESLAITGDLAYHIVLLTSEVLTNAMEHGTEWNEELHATLDIAAEADRVEVSVTDEGPRFDLSTVGDPIEEEDRLKGRGRGLFFMELMADEIPREADGRRLRLVIQRDGVGGWGGGDADVGFESRATAGSRQPRRLP